VLCWLPICGMSGGRRSIQGVNLASERPDTTRRESPGSGQAIECGLRASHRDLLVPLWQKHRSLLRDGVPPTSSHPRPSLSQKRDEMCMTFEKWEVSPGAQKLRRLYILSTDAGRSFVNVRHNFWDSDAHPRTPLDASSGAHGSGHLLMQQLAVPFDVSVKTGLSVGWPKISRAKDFLNRVHLLTMCTTSVGIGCSKWLTSEMHETCLLNNGDVSRLKNAVV